MLGDMLAFAGRCCIVCIINSDAITEGSLTVQMVTGKMHKGQVFCYMAVCLEHLYSVLRTCQSVKQHNIAKITRMPSSELGGVNLT